MSDTTETLVYHYNTAAESTTADHLVRAETPGTAEAVVHHQLATTAMAAAVPGYCYDGVRLRHHRPRPNGGSFSRLFQTGSSAENRATYASYQAGSRY